MNKLWVFGDSFTADYYPVDIETMPSNYDKYKKFRGGNLPDIWPKILSEKLNYELWNMAVGGDSNYGILNQYLNVCDLIRKGDMVIFGWANIARFMLGYESDGNFTQIVPCDNHYPHIGITKKTLDEIFYNRTHPKWNDEIRSWIRFINLYLSGIDVDVYHWTSDGKLFNGTTDFGKDDRKIIKITNQHYIESDLMSYLCSPYHYDMKNIAKIMEETNGEVHDWHFGEFGHIKQAEFFYNYIVNKIDV